MVVAKCKWCGKDIEKKGQLIYCSVECYKEKKKQWHKEYRQTETGKQQEKSYRQLATSKQYQKEYRQTEECKKKAKEYRQTDEYKKKAKEREKRKKEKQRRRCKEIIIGRCDWCKKEFEKNRTQKYCSTECYKEKKKQQNKEYRQSEMYRQKVKRYRKSEKGKQTARRRAQSEEYKRQQEEYRKTDEYKAKCRDRNSKRRALKRNAFVESVDHTVIAERDQWICQLCGKKISKRYKCPHPMSLEVDHIIPLSQGGEHSYANCQVVHKSCNCSKRDRVGPQGDQLRLC